MNNDRARLEAAVLQLVEGDPEGIVELVAWCMPVAPQQVVHSSRLPASARPAAAGWVFTDDAPSPTRVAVVLAPDGAAQAVAITWARGLLRRYPAPGVHDGYTLRLVDETVALELGDELARAAVERVDGERRELFSRAWSAVAREAIRAAVDRDRSLLDYAPPGWQPGPSARQRAIRELLGDVGISPGERAPRLADLLLEYGVPEVVTGAPLPFDERPIWMFFARFGDDRAPRRLGAAWRRRCARRARHVIDDAGLLEVGAACRADVSELAPVLLPALVARLRGVVELPFGDATAGE